MNKNYSKFISIILFVYLLVSLAGCKSSESDIGKMVGKWEANFIRADGYGTIDTRIELKMKRNNRCLERTKSNISGMLFQERKCTYSIRDDGRIWIEYDDGRVMQVAFIDDQLVLFGLFPSFGAEPNLTFSPMK